MSTEEDFYSQFQTKQAFKIGLLIIVAVFLACITFGISTLIAPLGVQIDAGLPPGTLLGGSDGSAVAVLILTGLLVIVSLFCIKLLLDGEFTLFSVIMMSMLASVLTVGSAAGTIINPVTESNSAVLSCVDESFVPSIGDMKEAGQSIMGVDSIRGDTVIVGRSPDGVLSLSDLDGRQYHC